MLIISFKLERNPEFYVFFLILPTMTITVTCLAALLLPIEIYQGERVWREDEQGDFKFQVNVGIAGLLGRTFTLSVIIVEVPRAPKLPLMGTYPGDIRGDVRRRRKRRYFREVVDHPDISLYVGYDLGCSEEFHS